MQFWALLVDSIRESLNRRIFWVLIIMTFVVALAMASIGFDGDNVTILFGMWETQSEHFNPLSGFGRSRLLGAVIYIVMSMFLGWIGIILIIVATASFFPSLMERGTIDVLLAKPISRSRLFLYKYVASLAFVLIQATVFVGLTFLVMGLRWKLWAPGYLLSIPLIVLLFSYVYCVSVLTAVKTRSATAAILISLMAWVIYVSPTLTLVTFEKFPTLKKHRGWYETVRVLSWILPKTGDIPYIAARWAEAGTSIDIMPLDQMPESPQEREEIERARELEQRELNKNPWVSIGSSLLFEAVVVMLAMASFSRKDY